MGLMPKKKGQMLLHGLKQIQMIHALMMFGKSSVWMLKKKGQMLLHGLKQTQMIHALMLFGKSSVCRIQ